jgi:alpha-glucosidase
MREHAGGFTAGAGSATRARWKTSLHSEVNPYFVSNPFPAPGEEVIVRLRMLPCADVKSVRLRTISSGRRILAVMEKEAESGGFARYRVALTMDQPRVHYHFIVETLDDVLFYNRNGVAAMPPLERDDFVILAGWQPPRWVAGAVFYHIFVDRFRKSAGYRGGVEPGEWKSGAYATVPREWTDRPLSWKEGRCLDFFNGDLAGIAEGIPHLEEFGVSALCLTPIFPAVSNHRYDILDFSRIDPHLGGDEALARLSRSLRDKGMRLILDITLNHTGSGHAWFRKASEDGDCPEHAFYHFDGQGGYAAWAGIPEYPKLDYRSRHLRRALYGNPESPIRKYLAAPFPVDGWRFDVGHETGNHGHAQLGHEVFREIRQAAKAARPDCYLLGEHPKDPQGYLDGDQWDASMNYYGSSRPLRWFAGEVDYYQKTFLSDPGSIRKRTGTEVAEMIAGHLGRLPSQMAFFQYNLLDSHDGPRFHTTGACGRPVLLGVLILLFLLPGAPSIYYGDEIGLSGGVDEPEDFRHPMEWDPGKWDHQLRHWYRTLGRLKSREEALHFGSYRFLLADENTLVFARFSDTRALIGLASNGGPARSVRIDLSALGSFREGRLREVFTSEAANLEGNDLVCALEGGGGRLWEGDFA